MFPRRSGIGATRPPSPESRWTAPSPPRSEFSHGWKEYITILVKGGSIVSVEYNAENASGFIKSWDNAYMQNMLHSNGTYPNEYTRYYAGPDPQLDQAQAG